MRLAILTLTLSLALSCVACSAIIPASQSDLEAMQVASAEFTAASIEASAQGNESTALLLAGMGGLTAVLTTVGMSRKRRAEAALLQATGTKKIPSLQPSATLG